MSIFPHPPANSILQLKYLGKQDYYAMMAASSLVFSLFIFIFTRFKRGSYLSKILL